MRFKLETDKGLLLVYFLKTFLPFYSLDVGAGEFFKHMSKLWSTIEPSKL